MSLDTTDAATVQQRIRKWNGGGIMTPPIAHWRPDMPPVNPPLKNDGPACRVCGCTQHNACPDVTKIGGRTVGIGCHWVEFASADAGPLCSACAKPIKKALASGC